MLRMNVFVTSRKTCEKGASRITMKNQGIAKNAYFIVYFTVYFPRKDTKDFILCQVFSSSGSFFYCAGKNLAAGMLLEGKSIFKRAL